MVWSLNSLDTKSSGHPLVLNVSYHSITSSVIFIRVQCESRRGFPVEGSQKIVLGLYIRFLVYINCIPGLILLMYLEIFYWLEAENLLIVHDSSKDELSRYFCVDQSCARFRRKKMV